MLQKLSNFNPKQVVCTMSPEMIDEVRLNCIDKSLRLYEELVTLTS